MTAAPAVVGEVQAGLVVYGSDDAYVALSPVSIWATRQTQLTSEVPSTSGGFSRQGSSSVVLPGDETWLRIVKRSTAQGARSTAYTSQDGVAWVGGGALVNDTLGPGARIRLVSMGAAGSPHASTTYGCGPSISDRVRPGDRGDLPRPGSGP